MDMQMNTQAKSSHWMRTLLVLVTTLLMAMALTAAAASAPPAPARLVDPATSTNYEPLPVDAAFALSSSVHDGDTLALEWTMPKGYYLYRDRFALKAINATDSLGELQWSEGTRHRDPQFGDVTVFYDRARLRVPVRNAAPLPEVLDVRVTFQGCLENNVCYPPTTRRLAFRLPPALREATADASASGLSLALVLFTALIGGLVLNLMPCVLPVLSLKVLSVLQAADDAIGARRRALAYTVGVMTSFAALGALVLGLRASGVAVGWGFQLQQPWMVASLALVLLAMGLGLSGVIHVGAGWAGIGGRHLQHRGLRGDFFTGVLACVVASPCTAPFMGTALTYALTSAQPMVAMLVFLALGLGLAAPFLLMAFFPATVRWLPRPGAWMETLKQLLAFPLYATAVWLLWVLGKQRGVDAMALVLLSAVALVLGLWWYEKHRFASALQRVVATGLVVVALLPLWPLAKAPAHATSQRALPQGAEPYTPARLLELRRKGVPVFVDVTADWCLTCRTNEAAVLDRSEFRALLARTRAAYLVADYTRPDPAIAALLREHGAVGLPLYLAFNRNGRRTRLPSLLSQSLVAHALEDGP
jgi:thiol:disulfide interchange protein